MKPQKLRAARLKKGWGQAEVAARLGVSQAYINMLEKGKRRLTPQLASKLAAVCDLSPLELPLSGAFQPAKVGSRRLVESLARLGYPGFAYLRPHGTAQNPAEVLLTVLAQDKLEARVAEALPWLPLRFWRMDSPWLVEQARKLNLQNRLGFVVGLARQVAERKSQNEHVAGALRGLEAALEKSRLANEDAFYRVPRTEGERVWLLKNRPEQARHWNLLTDLRPKHLPYAE